MALSKALESLTDFLLDNKSANWNTWGHALYIINTSKKQGLTSSHYWLHTLMWAVLRTSGGGILRGIILQEKPPVLSDKPTLPLILAAWYLTYFVKPFERVQASRPGTALIGAIEAVSKLRTITGGVDKAVQVLPDSPLAAIVIGVISGCGGTLLFDLEKYSRGELTNFSRPGWVLKITFWSALAYYAVVHYVKLVTPRRAKLMVGIFLLFNYLMRALYNPDFNVFKLIGLESGFYKGTNIPTVTH